MDSAFAKMRGGGAMGADKQEVDTFKESCLCQYIIKTIIKYRQLYNWCGEGH